MAPRTGKAIVENVEMKNKVMKAGGSKHCFNCSAANIKKKKKLLKHLNKAEKSAMFGCHAKNSCNHEKLVTYHNLARKRWPNHDSRSGRLCFVFAEIDAEASTMNCPFTVKLCIQACIVHNWTICRKQRHRSGKTMGEELSYRPGHTRR